MCTCKYCNREFDSYLALGGHISHCVNNPNRRKSEDYKKFQSAGITASLERLNKEKENDPYRYKVKEFILTCPRCGENFSIVTTQKNFDKGNHKTYCSRKCANGHTVSSDTKEKIGKSVSKFAEEHPKEKKIHLYTCKHCGKTYTISESDCNSSIYCSAACKHKHLSERTGGYRKGSGRGKGGWYKGIYCDSTWELAFVIYCLDHNLNISRCKEPRKYVYNNETHLYYPDFVTDDGIIEIKGYSTDIWKAKAMQNPDIKVLYKEDIQKYLNYVYDHYTKDLESLYEY